MSLQNIGDVTVRTATSRDQDKIIELVFGVLAEYGLRPDPESTDADLKDIEGNYLRSGGLFELIEDRQGRLLGTVGLFPVDDETCELRKMYLLREARGLGLGKRILERAISHAREQGFKRIRLETADVLKDAVRLYMRFGFVAVESAHLSARCDQAYELDLTE